MGFGPGQGQGQGQGQGPVRPVQDWGRCHGLCGAHSWVHGEGIRVGVGLYVPPTATTSGPKASGRSILPT